MNTRSISLAVMTLTIVAALTGCGSGNVESLRVPTLAMTTTAAEPPTSTQAPPPTPSPTVAPTAIVIVVTATPTQPAPTPAPALAPAQPTLMPPSRGEPCPGATRTNSACDRAQMAAQANGGNQP